MLMDDLDPMSSINILFQSESYRPAARACNCQTLFQYVNLFCLKEIQLFIALSEKLAGEKIYIECLLNYKKICTMRLE